MKTTETIVPIYSPNSLPCTQELAQRYGFTICNHFPATPYMNLDENGLCFIDPSNPKEKLQVNFAAGRTGYRLTSIQGTAQPLLKALGFSKKAEHPLRVLDTTAGLGGDGMLMAVCGCEVTMLERNGGMLALLEDGLRRAEKEDEVLAEVIHSKIRCIHCNSREFIRSATPQVDVIYLDPMFPQRKKSALVKKEMRLAKLLAGEDEDATELLKAALDTGLRTVVKRPAKAEALAEGFKRQITGKAIRFDLYNC